MNFSINKVVAAVDIGAGKGAKLGIASLENFNLKFLKEGLIERVQYGQSTGHFTVKLAQKINQLLKEQGIPLKQLASIGIALPGFLDSFDRILYSENISFLNKTDIKKQLSQLLHVPITMMNDGDCGGIAEWNLRRHELLYWVLGGGWGGSWISKEGRVNFPTTHWEGDESAIHLTNEPGYCIPITKKDLEVFFKDHGASFSRFLELYTDELKVFPSQITGPNRNPDTIRTEVLVSGSGLWRIFGALLTKSEATKLPENIQLAIKSPAAAGPAIQYLFHQKNECALRTIHLFSLLMEKTAIKILDQATQDGAPKSIPIILGGGLANAFELLSPQVQKAIRQAGYQSPLLKSYYLEQKLNANLIGAVQQAIRAVSPK